MVDTLDSMKKNKWYKYYDLDGPQWINNHQIINEYFQYWSEKMASVGKAAEISYEKCIEDFCVVHWAFEVENYGD